MTGRGIVVAAVALALAALTGCRPMERVSEGAYRHAVADGAAAELRRRGVAMDGPPGCTMNGTRSTVQVRCHGRTADGRPVTVTGTATDADTDRPRERYVIAVAGRQVLRTPCLADGCHPR